MQPKPQENPYNNYPQMSNQPQQNNTGYNPNFDPNTYAKNAQQNNSGLKEGDIVNNPDDLPF